MDGMVSPVDGIGLRRSPVLAASCADPFRGKVAAAAAPARNSRRVVLIVLSVSAPSHTRCGAPECTSTCCLQGNPIGCTPCGGKALVVVVDDRRRRCRQD